MRIVSNATALAGAGLIACLILGGCLLPVWAQSSQPASRYGPPIAVCKITDPRLDEASGLVASRRNPGLYYTHNDSGGKPHVYALDRTGRIFATIRLAGAANVDWEDIALAPGAAAGEWDVCVADIGDNNARRAEVDIYRFPEPDLKGAVGRTVDAKAVRYRCKYEDGPRNAEGFAVDPASGDGFVFTKRWDGACRIYGLNRWHKVDFNTLKRVASLNFSESSAPPLARTATAADISGDGRRLVTRSYLGGWEWRLPNSDGVTFKSIFEQTPAALTLASETQGEALCFSADGAALLTISEKTPTTLYESRLNEKEHAKPAP